MLPKLFSLSGKSINFTCIAEDPRKTSAEDADETSHRRGRPYGKQADSSKTASFVAALVLTNPAAVSAEDLRKSPRKTFGQILEFMTAGVISGSHTIPGARWAHERFPHERRIPRNFKFTCTAEDPRKMRGRSAEDLRGSHNFGNTQEQE